jgi:hypothetical protein
MKLICVSAFYLFICIRITYCTIILTSNYIYIYIYIYIGKVHLPPSNYLQICNAPQSFNFCNVSSSLPLGLQCPPFHTQYDENNYGKIIRKKRRRKSLLLLFIFIFIFYFLSGVFLSFWVAKWGHYNLNGRLGGHCKFVGS